MFYLTTVRTSKLEETLFNKITRYPYKMSQFRTPVTSSHHAYKIRMRIVANSATYKQRIFSVTIYFTVKIRMRIVAKSLSNTQRISETYCLIFLEICIRIAAELSTKTQRISQ